MFLNLPEVIDSAIVGTTHPDKGQIPHCFVVYSNKNDLTDGMLRQALSGGLCFMLS